MDQKVIQIGSSIGVVIPADMAKRRGIELGQEVTTIEQENGDILISRHTSMQNKEVSAAVARATAYIEKYRKDFEALANK